ncbi:MAG: aminopeptidase [Burkholderiales bacterium]
MSAKGSPASARVVAAFCATVLLAGCSAFEAADYYWQGAAGQLEILSRAKPIADVIDSSDDAALRARLTRVQDIRHYASRELALPDNASYTRYSDLGRSFVVWNVFAAPPLSLTARQWCFPVAGCVNYRGYFNEADALAEAARMAAAGDDVWVSGVPAYSTLGYFDDPVLSTFVRWPETEVARMVFHELAHQVVYVKDDSTFNESFAVTVEEEGLRRWLKAQDDAKLDAQFVRSEKLREVFRTLTASAREQLQALYASPASDTDKRAGKAEILARMRTEYEGAKAGAPGLAGYDRWFAGRDNAGPNNASLVSVALYTKQVPAFRAVLAEVNGDLPRFYERVREIGQLAKAERDATLAAALQGAVHARQ